MTSTTRAVGLALGYAADLVWGDPQRRHPVAAFGSVALWLQDRLYEDDRRHGLAYVVTLVGGAVGLGALLDLATRRTAIGRAAVTAAATWAVLGGTSLAREGDVMARLVQEDDLTAARSRLSHLCSRDATGLDAAELARAATESLAENTSDAVTAPLFWGAVAGVPGLLAYRAANTLDAMVGYRSPRFLRFGWAAARLDDALNYVPARLTAGLTVCLAPTVGGRPADAWRAWRRDAPRHPSPNAGPVEATAAGALGITLGGTNTYDGETENRGTLGHGPAAGVGDLPRAVRLSRVVGAASLVAAVAVALGTAATRSIVKDA